MKHIKILIILSISIFSLNTWAVWPALPVAFTTLLRLTTSMAANDARLAAARAMVPTLETALQSTATAAIKTTAGRGIAAGTVAVWANSSIASSYSGSSSLYSFSSTRVSFGYSSYSSSSSSSSSLYSLGSANFGWSGGGGGGLSSGNIWYLLK